jgi:SNF2 family DNA or RNA helicase
MKGPYLKAGYLKSVGKDLYDHQKEALSISINRKNNAWWLEQGMGKSLTAATLSKITGAKRTIIITPTLTKYNYLYDMTRDWGYNELYWTILDAKKSKNIKAFRERFVVVNYEQVRKYMDYLLGDEVNHIVIDEVQAYKNHKSQRSKDVYEFINRAKNPRITLLSGTPITNRVDDMFNYLRMTQHPLGDNFEEFKRRYAITASVRGGKIIGAKNVGELKGLTSNLSIRMKSEDCLDLPDMIIKNYYMEVSEIKKEYDALIGELKEKKEKYDSLHGKEKAAMNMEMRGNIHTLNRLVATAKVPMIKNLVDSFLEAGEKVVVFSGYKDPLNMLNELYGETSVLIDGSVNSHKRQVLIDRFKDKDECKVFLGNYKAAGVGINLVNATRVVMVNFPFLPADIEQAQKRLHRSGQKNRVFVYYTMANNTIDNHIYDIIIDKSEDINALVDGNHKGVINYSNIQKQLFRSLLEK